MDDNAYDIIVMAFYYYYLLFKKATVSKPLLSCLSWGTIVPSSWLLIDLSAIFQMKTEN